MYESQLCVAHGRHRVMVLCIRMSSNRCEEAGVHGRKTSGPPCVNAHLGESVKTVTNFLKPETSFHNV